MWNMHHWISEKKYLHPSKSRVAIFTRPVAALEKITLSTIVKANSNLSPMGSEGDFGAAAS